MPETLSIRRTLIIGMGTTGKGVAEAVAEHLAWQFGGHERAAWVRLLVLETASKVSPLGDRVLHVGIKREDYTPYLNAPRTAGAGFDFAGWQDSRSLSAIDNPSSGAGNLRMLGRLCLFHDDNYQNIQRWVTGDLSYLNGLTPQAVTDSLGETYKDTPVDIHPDIVVYVVGTLCGGTCSGGAADMGYLLREWSGDGIDCQAIFTLPHPQYAGTDAPRLKKNAYYALKELNHYQLAGTAWMQKLPDKGSASRRAERPYVILRAMMPGGPDGSDVTRLNVMIGQYLAAASGPAGGAIADLDVNAKGKMDTAEQIGFMRPLFSTMGVAALEYPGEHILRAATMRLTSGALEHWCRHTLTPQRINEALRLLGGSDFEAQMQRLTEGADTLSVAVFQQKFRPEGEGAIPRVEQARQLLREVDGRLTAQDLPRGDVSGALPTLLHVMENNHKTFLNRIESDVEQFVARALFDLDGGPGFVAAVLREQMNRMEAWAREAQANLPEYQQDSKSLRAILDEQIAEVERVQADAEALFKARVPILPGPKRQQEAAKQEIVREEKQKWEEVTNSVYSYLQTELRTQAATHLQRRQMLVEMLDKYRQATAVLLRRLDVMQSAFTQTATSLRDAWQKTAKDKPLVNGKVYFEAEPPAARGTVTEEYYNLLRQRAWDAEPATGWGDDKKEEAAQRDVLTALGALKRELLPNTPSAFDPNAARASAQESIPQNILDALEARSRAFFEILRRPEQGHVAKKAAQNDVDTVIQQSTPRLRISGAQISPHLHGARAVTAQEQNLAFLDLAYKHPLVTAMVTKINNSIRLARREVTDNQDPFRLLIVQERHGFTFGQMEGVISSHDFDLNTLQSAETATDFPFWHTRRDVTWINPLVPPRRVEETEERWLQVILLGKPADGLFAWTPANKQEIDGRGWYQVANGEFRVFYPPGIPGVTVTEERLPLDFNSAVMRLLTPEYGTLRECLNTYLSGYRHDFQAARMVSALSDGWKALSNLGLTGLDSDQANHILRRAYKRDPLLTDAFFEYETEGSKDAKNLFFHLFKMQGTEIADTNKTYAATAYFCPICNNLLSDNIEDLRAAHFVCPKCNERYWPS